jgi:hypothetical protein
MSHYVKGLEFKELAKKTTYIYCQDFIKFFVYCQSRFWKIKQLFGIQMWNLKIYYNTPGDNIISHLHLLTIFLLK